MNDKKYFEILLATFLIAFSTYSQAQEKYDLFYVNIGSAYYLNLDSLLAANTAAKQMSNLFDRLGAIEGITELSTNSNPIDSTKIFSAIKKIIRKAKKRKHPLIVFYYAGHGFTSGVDKSVFIPTYDFDYRVMENATQEEWLDKMITPLQIKEILDESRMDFMIMLDCCYFGNLKDNDLANNYIIQYAGLEEMDSLMKQTFEIFAAMNIMTGTNPVIFSCPPGQSVVTEPYNFGDGKENTAPLCRRAHIVIDHKLKNVSISISDFLVMMLSDDIDPTTNSAYSAWKFDSKNLNYLYLIK